MDLDDMLIRVHPGEGLVARAGGSVLVLLAPVPDQPSVADELLGLVVGSADEAAPGRQLAQRVARLVAGAEPGDVPAFGLVAQAEDGLLVMLHGNTDADASGPGGREHLSGRQVATWADRILGQPVDLLTVGPSGKPLETPDPRVRLQTGVVHGGGFSVVPAGVAQPPGDLADAQVPEALADPQAPEALAEVAADVVVEREAEPPIPLPPMDVVPSDDTEVVVARSGRPTIGSEPEPALSGAFQSMLPEVATPDEMSAEPVEVDSLPPGMIVFDDGASFSLDGDYVLGREPALDPDVASGHARPLVVEDPDRTVSRVHAAIALDGRNVVLTDRGAANGTYVAGPGQDDWVPLLPNKPTMLEAGTRVRLGDREFRFDSFPAEQ